MCRDIAWLEDSEAIAPRDSMKQVFLKSCKIYRKTPLSGSLCL